MRTQESSSEPKPGDDVDPVICTPSFTAWSTGAEPACAGMTTV